MKKRFLLVLAGIMGLAFIASGCKDKKTTKETTAKTTVQTTATPTTTEDIKLFKTDKETFDSFFAYDETGLKSVNFEAEDLIKREGKEDQETTLIVADGRVNTVKWNTIYVIAKDEDKYSTTAYMKNESGEYEFGGFWTDSEFKNICFSWFLPILDYSKMTFDETKRCYVSSEVVTLNSTSASSTNVSTISNIEVKFYNNKPLTVSYKEVLVQTGSDFEYTETSYRTVTYKSFGSSTVVDPTPVA